MADLFRKHEDGYEAVPAVVVADKTDKLGKRLAQLAFGLLLLFFTVNGYIQGAQNGRQLDQADKDRAQLVSSLERATTTLEQQSKLILQLQAAVRAQNQTLRDAGLTTLAVPGEMTLPGANGPGQVIVSPPDSADPPAPRASQKNNPDPDDPDPNDPEPNDPDPNDPEPEPEPDPPGPADPATDLLCQVSGICT